MLYYNKIIYLILLSSFVLIVKESIIPIPLDIKKVNLGKNCHSCHILVQAGNDNLQFSVANNKKMGNINAPRILNLTLNFIQFWNGRAINLQEQVLGPMTNSIEMGHNFEELIKKRRKKPL